jgi:hypothetical protein
MDIGSGMALSVGIVTVGGGLLTMYRLRSNKTNGSLFVNRPQWMSSETKAEIGKLWDEKQSKEQCLTIANGIKEDIEEIKTSQQLTQKGISEIQSTLINWSRKE